MVRRTAAALNATWAGVAFVASFAMVTTSMAAFNKERTLSRPFGFWDLVAIAKLRGGCEKTVRCGGHEEELGS